MIHGSQDNVIDFMEFVAAVHLVLRGKLEDRLKWSFKVYDRDENGKLDRSEVKHIIKVRAIQLLTVTLLPETLYYLAAHPGVFIFVLHLQIIYKLRDNNSDMTPNEICERIFELVDSNKDGKISLARKITTHKTAHKNYDLLY